MSYKNVSKQNPIDTKAAIDQVPIGNSLALIYSRDVFERLAENVKLIKNTSIFSA